jgi:hypothetical protein
LIFRLTKSSRIFYAQVERGSFRTGSVDGGRSAIGSKMAAVGGELPFLNGLVAAAPVPIPDVRA